MARVVETVAAEFAHVLEWKKVITKDPMGASRYQELSNRLGRPAPVPAIFINGELRFEQTPGTEELAVFLRQMITAR